VVKITSFCFFPAADYYVDILNWFCQSPPILILVTRAEGPKAHDTARFSVMSGRNKLLHPHRAAPSCAVNSSPRVIPPKLVHSLLPGSHRRRIGRRLSIVFIGEVAARQQVERSLFALMAWNPKPTLHYGTQS